VEEKMLNNKWTPLEHYIPPGWIPLVEELIVKLHAFPFPIEVTQIKEKFGGLRFYFFINGEHDQLLNEKVWKLVNTAEAESYNICQDCGKPGSYKQLGYWGSTWCDSCFKRAEIAKKNRLTGQEV
jgi:hypothetical protein